MHARLPLLALVICCGSASCASDTNTAPVTSSPATTSSPVTSSPVTSIPVTSGPVTVSTGLFGGAEPAACATDLDQMQTVVESYLALNGGTEVTEAELVQQGLLREESTLHDVGPGGTVIPSPSGGCVS